LHCDYFFWGLIAFILLILSLIKVKKKSGARLKGKTPMLVKEPGSWLSDGFVKSPSAALRCILSHCGVQVSTPHSVGFARLASEAFFFAV
jgi:hypothetical protein